MIEPVFYLLLVPPGLAILVAAIVAARGGGIDRKRTVRIVCLILVIGLLIPVLLFVGFTALYHAGGGH